MTAHIDEKVMIRRNCLSLMLTFFPAKVQIVCQTFNIVGKIELSALFRSFASLLRAHYSQLINTTCQAAAV